MKVNSFGIIVSGILFSVLSQIPTAVLGLREEASSLAVYRHSSLFMEFAGNGILYSINYDHRFTEHLSGRVGVGAFPGIFVPGAAVFSPIIINYLTGVGNGHLEIGLGTTILADIAPNFIDIDPVLTATIGYRYHTPDGGFLFRIGLTPLYGINDD